MRVKSLESVLELIQELADRIEELENSKEKEDNDLERPFIKEGQTWLAYVDGYDFDLHKVYITRAWDEGDGVESVEGIYYSDDFFWTRTFLESELKEFLSYDEHIKNFFDNFRDHLSDDD